VIRGILCLVITAIHALYLLTVTNAEGNPDLCDVASNCEAGIQQRNNKIKGPTVSTTVGTFVATRIVLIIGSRCFYRRYTIFNEHQKGLVQNNSGHLHIWSGHYAHKVAGWRLFDHQKEKEIVMPGSFFLFFWFFLGYFLLFFLLLVIFVNYFLLFRGKVSCFRGFVFFSLSLDMCK